MSADFVTLADIVSVVAFGIALCAAIRIPVERLDRASKNFACLFLGISIFVGMSNVLEHAGITDSFDRYEDYAEILFIPLFLFFIYSVLTKNELDKRTRTEDDLRIKNSALESTPAGVILTDLRGNISYANRAVLGLWGYGEEREVLGRPVSDFCEKFEDQIIGILFKKEEWIGEINAKRRDGTVFDIQVTANLVKSGAGRPVSLFASIMDITDRKKMEERLKAMSFTDDLTGLLNRRGFFSIAERELKRAARGKRKIVLLYADLDNLKNINDTYGHGEGDMALIDTAHMLQETFRGSDIIARVGGDEFAIIIADCTETDFEHCITNRLEEKIRHCNETRKRPYGLSVSRGIIPYDGQSPVTIDDLLAQGDNLMYQHKKSKTA